MLIVPFNVKGQDSIPKTINDSLLIDVQICEEAQMILADTLKYNKLYDQEALWSGEVEVGYPSVYLLPVVFKGIISPSNFSLKKKEEKKLPFNVNPEDNVIWLDEEMWVDSLRESALTRALSVNPRVIDFDALTWGETPKQESVSDVSAKEVIKVSGPVIQADNLNMGKPKPDRWKSRMTSMVQFTQNYVSDNWYQGGESNINILGYQNLFVKRYDLSGKTEFENTTELRTGFYTTPSDTMRMFRVNDNLLRNYTKFGLRAFKSKWYYSGSFDFRTQVFNNYKANTNDLLSQILSPTNMVLSLGMDYKFKSKKGTFDYSLFVAPLAATLIYVANTSEIDETRLGVEKDKKTKKNLGSNFRQVFTWKISKNVTWYSNLYVFSPYDYINGDMENRFSFTVNKYLSATIQTYTRYDDSRDDVKKWQFKQQLTFGFNYVW